jgi:hypothetical protein
MRMYAALGAEAPHPWLSTHPGHEERAEYAASVAREAGGRECR